MAVLVERNIADTLVALELRPDFLQMAFQILVHSAEGVLCFVKSSINTLQD